MSENINSMTYNVLIYMNKCVELDILKSKMKLVHDIHKKISNGRNTITFGLKLQFLEILNTSFGSNPRQGKLFELMDELGIKHL